MIPPMLTHIFIYMLLLPEGQMDEAWKPSKNNAPSDIRDHWIEKYFPLFQTSKA
jgi:hypothetical protein